MNNMIVYLYEYEKKKKERKESSLHIQIVVNNTVPPTLCEIKYVFQLIDN